MILVRYIPKCVQKLLDLDVFAMEFGLIYYFHLNLSHTQIPVIIQSTSSLRNNKRWVVPGRPLNFLHKSQMIFFPSKFHSSYLSGFGCTSSEQLNICNVSFLILTILIICRPSRDFETLHALFEILRLCMPYLRFWDSACPFWDFETLHALFDKTETIHDLRMFCWHS